MKSHRKADHALARPRAHPLSSEKEDEPSNRAMSRLLLVVVAGSIGLVAGAIGGAVLSPSRIESSPRETARVGELVDVLVATRTIPAGTELGYAVVERKEMPARFVTSSMVRAEDVGQLVGENVLMTILEGDPIFWSHLVAGAPESICDWVREASSPRPKE